MLKTGVLHVISRKWKKEHLFKTEIFCNIINIFTGNFDQFNEPLLNKKILIYFKKNIWLTPAIRIVVYSTS